MRHYIKVQVLQLVFPMRTKSYKSKRKEKKKLTFTEHLLSVKQLEILYSLHCLILMILSNRSYSHFTVEEAETLRIK